MIGLLYNIRMLKIVSTPNPILSKPARGVDKIDAKIKQFVIEMEETLLAQSDTQGVGLAANQVGSDLAIFISKKSPDSETQVFINPKILKVVNKTVKKSPTKRKRRANKLEGCLSIPRIWGPVERARKVYLEYQDLTGTTYKKWFAGFEAVIVQHEMDHLQGVVFTQRSLEQEAPLYKEVDGKLKPFEV